MKLICARAYDDALSFFSLANRQIERDAHGRVSPRMMQEYMRKQMKVLSDISSIYHDTDLKFDTVQSPDLLPGKWSITSSLFALFLGLVLLDASAFPFS